MTNKNRFFAGRDIRFLDTTLRDGEQTPGVSLSVENKVEIALALARLGVKMIEVGSPITSEGERDAIKAIVKALGEAGFNDVVIACFCRIRKEDIDFAFECGVKLIHLVVPVSDLHIDDKLKSDRKTVRQNAVNMTGYAKGLGLKVEISGEDASRANLEYLISVYQACVEAGADRICFCDTVGCLDPERISKIFKKLAREFDVPIAVHCHDDLGLAVANTIAALKAGATEAHATINGIGERAGNAALEEVAVILENLYGCNSGIVLKNIYSISRLVSRLTGIPIAPNKALVGQNAFAHESGIHLDGIMKNSDTYQFVKPEDIGRVLKIILGKHSGKSSIILKLRELGLEAIDTQLGEILFKVKSLGDKGKRITDADFEAIAEVVLGVDYEPRVVLIDYLETSDGHSAKSSVTLQVDGRVITKKCVGNGPVNAATNAVEACIVDLEIVLNRYHVNSISEGTDAQVEVVVEASSNAKTITARGIDTNVVKASIDAFIEAINRLIK